jgi:regulator of sigma E protease
LLKIKKGDTEYGIGWFPLGGYVKIAGMVDESMDKEQLKNAPEPWEFRAKPAWQRLIVMLGGIIVNVIVGIIIFIGMVYFIGDHFVSNKYVNDHGGVQAMELAQQIGFKTGDKVIGINGNKFNYFDEISKPDVLLSQNSYYTVLRDGKEVNISIPSDFIEQFNKKEAVANFLLPRRLARVDVIGDTSLAKRILQKGDVITEIEGQPITYIDEVKPILANLKGDSIHLKVKRGDAVLTFNEPFKSSSIGFSSFLPKDSFEEVRYSFGRALTLGPSRAFNVIFVQLKAFKKIFTGQISFKKSLSGPIGMAQAYGGEWDWENFWRMTGLLSMVLAFMNLLPIPGLDGGYVMFLLYEMVSGREPNEKVFETALKIGMAILLVLMVFVFYNDIAKLITGG